MLARLPRRRVDRLDVLAANAGIADAQPFMETEEASWRRIIDVNLTGTFFCMQEAARAMIPAGGGARSFRSGPRWATADCVHS